MSAAPGRVRCVACNMGASSEEDFTRPDNKYAAFNQKVTRSIKYYIDFVNNLVNVALALPSQVKDDLNTFAQHAVGLVFYCELHKDHQDRVHLPQGWRKQGKERFMIAMAPGWKLYHAEVLKVWPHVTTDRKRNWRVYYQAGRWWCDGTGRDGTHAGTPTPPHPPHRGPHPTLPQPSPPQPSPTP